MSSIFYESHASIVAPQLLGRELIYGECRGIIVEVEAYQEDDPASHSFRGKSARNQTMFLGGGHIYVYRIYGIHQCMNIVTGPPERGEAVLIRACEPTGGIMAMWRNRYEETLPQDYRKNSRYRDLCRGPGRLTRAFGISVEEHNGSSLHDGTIRITEKVSVKAPNIICGSRIGISKGQERPWRWYIESNRFVSAKTSPKSAGFRASLKKWHY